MSLFYEIFASPARGFRRIKESPGWVQALVPVIILFVLFAVFEFLFRLVTFKEWTLQNLQLAYGISPQEVLSDPDLASLLVPDMSVILRGVWNGIVMLFLGLLVQTVIFHFSLTRDNKLLAASVAVVAWAKFPLIIAWVLKLLVGAVAKAPVVSFSPAAFVAPGSVLAPGLEILDIFSLWTLVLTAIGFSVITEKKTLSWGLVFGLWALLFVGMLIKGMAFG